MQLETIKLRVLTKSTKWYNRAHLVSLYHSIRQAGQQHWTIRDTAKGLEISVGSVHNYLKLQDALEKNPDLKNMSLKKALESNG